MKTKTGLCAVIVALCGFATLLSGENTPITFESAESQTIDGQPVYNEIQLFKSKHKHIWVMRQSHDGPHLGKHKWDRLAIVVDTGRSPKQASFYQYEPGQNIFDDNAKPAEFRASCFQCHANGPRAIRPKMDSQKMPVSIKDRVRLAWWNFQMARLGRIMVAETQKPFSLNESHTPFRLTNTYSNHTLPVDACVACHHDGPTGRGELVRQQAATIKFLVENKQMPPAGFPFPKKDKVILRRFLKGF